VAAASAAAAAVTGSAVASMESAAPEAIEVTNEPVAAEDVSEMYADVQKPIP